MTSPQASLKFCCEPQLHQSSFPFDEQGVVPSANRGPVKLPHNGRQQIVAHKAGIGMQKTAPHPPNKLALSSSIKFMQK
jgi:hypothetical protein